MQEGVIAGIPAVEVWDWTIGEILPQVRATHERRRRDGRMLSSVAVGEVQMIAAYLSGKKGPEIWDVFPFWTDAEITQNKVEKYKHLIWRHVGGGNHG